MKVPLPLKGENNRSFSLDGLDRTGHSHSQGFIIGEQ